MVLPDKILSSIKSHVQAVVPGAKVLLFGSRAYGTPTEESDCFHATKALLLTRDLVPKTHSGVVAMLHQHFVQAGLFDFEQASFFSRLMQERIEDDYNDVIIIDEA